MSKKNARGRAKANGRIPVLGDDRCIVVGLAASFFDSALTAVRCVLFWQYAYISEEDYEQ